MWRAPAPLLRWKEGVVDQHECGHPEVLIEEVDESPDGVLRAGMRVLIPCPVCGETPLDSLATEQARNAELQAALLAHRPNMPLYHWSPRVRRKQIERYGLRPGMRATTTTGNLGAMCVCFADSPSWAWALSGGMDWTPVGEWDLWQTWLEALDDPVVLSTPDRPSGLYEVRTESRVYKRNLWWAGERTK